MNCVFLTVIVNTLLFCSVTKSNLCCIVFISLQLQIMWMCNFIGRFAWFLCCGSCIHFFTAWTDVELCV